jgi:hypothetical protein
MAVNESRSMNGEFHQGSVDNTYIQLTPNRGGITTVVPIEKLDWLQYQNAERWADNPFGESRMDRLPLPRERKTATSGDFRY